MEARAEDDRDGATMIRYRFVQEQPTDGQSDSTSIGTEFQVTNEHGRVSKEHLLQMWKASKQKF